MSYLLERTLEVEPENADQEMNRYTIQKIGYEKYKQLKNTDNDGLLKK